MGALATFFSHLSTAAGLVLVVLFFLICFALVLLFLYTIDRTNDFRTLRLWKGNEQYRRRGDAEFVGNMIVVAGMFQVIPPALWLWTLNRTYMWSDTTSGSTRLSDLSLSTTSDNRKSHVWTLNGPV